MKEYTKITNQKFPNERDLYHRDFLSLNHCQFKGIEDGESALKECLNINIDQCEFDLRYPLWHDKNLFIKHCLFTSNSRASLWYGKNICIEDSKLLGIKAVRECCNVNIANCLINSNEFAWKSNKVNIVDSEITSEYGFLLSKNICLKNIKFQGKYSFQYVKRLYIEKSILNTKDAFWHARDVVVKDSVLNGEYLGWYSHNLTLINCHIKGTQPLCYCSNLKLINCTMEDADLAFEYSHVHAEIIGEVISIKNPRSGKITLDKCYKIINKDSKYKNHCRIIIRQK